tara:strand:+ start:251 stop:574 length:324 start_codon:yes stop_codon:yes gene_type:complete
VKKFEDRIVQPKGYLMPVVQLSEEEDSLYKGAGNAIAYTKNDAIIKLVYLSDYEHLDDLLKEIKNKRSIFLGMLSSYEFCDPRKLSFDNPTSFARLARLHAEEFEEI